jgi:peptidylprolyl isomerase
MAHASSSSPSSSLVYIDLDFENARAAYKRAVSFVSTHSIKYGLSSNILSELGGRELQSVPDLALNDFAWSQANPGPVITRPQRATRLVFALDAESSPLACENFTALCTGSKGVSKNSHLPLHYKGSRIHRYHAGLGIVQGGDIQFGNGSGGESIWGKKFKDDVKGLKLRHDKRGVLSMGNGGKNSNSSQFFVTLLPRGAPVCDKKHVVFGQVVHGFDTLDLMQEFIDAAAGAGTRSGAAAGSAAAADEEEAPPISIVVTECGLWQPSDLQQGYWDENDAFVAF